jgi:hypothetical protein
MYLKRSFKYKTQLKHHNFSIFFQRKGTLRLHPACVAEMETALAVTYELPSCQLCKHPVIVSRLAHRCAGGGGCGSQYHACCLQKCVIFIYLKCKIENCIRIFKYLFN